MASAAPASTCMLLLAALFMGLAAADHGGKDVCFQQVDEVPMTGSCLCYDKCSDGGGLKTASSQICFVNCVLGWGCVCSGDSETPAKPPPTPPPTKEVPSAAAVLPALLDGTIRVAVTRPMVSRSLNEKDEPEEVLVVEVTFEDDDPPFFSIHVNAPEGGEPEQFRWGDSVDSGSYSDEERSAGKAVRRNPIDRWQGGAQALADGDKTIVVSIWPLSVDRSKEHRLTVAAIRIEYQPTFD